MSFLFSLVISLILALPTLGQASVAQSDAEANSLALQMARRMVLLHQSRPLPSPGLAISSHLVRKKQKPSENKQLSKSSRNTPTS